MATLVITCESCGTRFKLDSDKLDKPRKKVRCSKCKNVFIVEQPDEDGLINIEITDEESAFIPGTIQGEIGGVGVADKQEGWSLKKKILLAGGAAVLILAIAALVLSPGGPLRLFTSKSPPAGPPKPVVTITDSVQAYYLENVHSGQVLVIEGEVLNESSQPVSFVMIEGKLFNSKDKVAQTQRCYVGNSFTRKDVVNLKLSEIEEKMMNREGKNLKNVRIPPGGKVPFMLVFHDLPEISTLSNYSVNVVSSKFD